MAMGEAQFVEGHRYLRTVPMMNEVGASINMLFQDITTSHNTYSALNNETTTTTTTTTTTVSPFTTTTSNDLKNIMFRAGLLDKNFSTTSYDDSIPSFEQSDENTFLTLRYTFSIIRLCLAIFGVVANSVTCYVLTYKKLWSPTTLLLMTLVIYDALFLLASIPLCLVDAFLSVDMDTFAIICGFIYPIRYMAQTGSIYTLGTLTIERYLIVLRPFKARIFCSFGKIKRFIIFIFCFSIIFNIPRCFFYSLATSYTPLWATNMTSFQNSTPSFLQDGIGPQDTASLADIPTEMSAPIIDDSRSSSGDDVSNHVVKNSHVENYAQSESAQRHEFYLWLYTRVYELYISSAFLYLLPYALIPLLNVQLLLAIKERRHETRSISLKDEHKQLKNTKATNREDGLTMIVLGITVCFFICCLIPAIYNVTQMAKVSATSQFSFYLLIASDTMLCVNASTDFFFYCLLGAKFRNAFLHIFCNKSECVRGRGGAGRSPLTNGHSRHSDTYYHTVV